jgi:hypothetical protein
MQWGGIMKAKKKNNQWEWESVKITLTDPNGETITLNSLDLSDYCMTTLHNEIQFYVEEKGGELK